MTALVAADVTVTLVERRTTESRKLNKVKIVFGDGSKTYPAGGIPISKGKFGTPNNLESILSFDTNGGGYQVDYDYTNQKLRLFQSAAQSASPQNLAEFATGAAVPASQIRAEVIGW